VNSYYHSVEELPPSRPLYKDVKIEVQFYLLFCIGVKLGLTPGWDNRVRRYLRLGCWN